jgi:hypothetical protein
MIYIAAIAVIGIVLLQASGAVPQASVGGPLTLALAFFAAVLAVAIHEAWTKRRGVLGWIVNVVLSFVGAFVAVEVGNIVMELLLVALSATGLLAAMGGMSGSLASTGGPLLYLMLAAMMLWTILGSWLALKVVNRWR